MILINLSEKTTELGFVSNYFATKIQILVNCNNSDFENNFIEFSKLDSVQIYF